MNFPYGILPCKIGWGVFLGGILPGGFCRGDSRGGIREGGLKMEDNMRQMTQELWDSMSPAQKDAVRDLSGLSLQLVGLEGYRVEVETTYNETRRFRVGRSTGWVNHIVALLF